MSTKNSNDTIGNRSGDLPVCSAVPQPTAPPAACPLDQRNPQVFKLFIYLFISALHVSGFLLAHLQRQVCIFGSGSSLLGMVSAVAVVLIAAVIDVAAVAVSVPDIRQVPNRNLVNYSLRNEFWNSNPAT
jgi:hypothetical protein